MLFLDELNELVAGNLPDVKDLVPPRREHRRCLASLEPPFIFNGRSAADLRMAVPRGRATGRRRCRAGTRSPACPAVPDGRGAGPAIVLTPTSAAALEPGDVLVAPGTDPSWTPLFVPAAAVVVDVGAALEPRRHREPRARHPVRAIGWSTRPGGFPTARSSTSTATTGP